MASLSFLHLFIVLVIVCTVSGDSTTDVMQRTLPAYAIALKADKTLNASTCTRELGVFRNAVDIRKLWALKVLDSSGEPKPGFIYGNNYWLSIRTQCFETSNRKPFQLNEAYLQNISKLRKAEDEFPPYKLNYFVAHLKHNSTLLYRTRILSENLITLGLCLPASCTTNQLSLIMKKILQERTLMVDELYAANFELEIVRDLRDDHISLLTGRRILVVSVLVITLFLVIVGTIYDVLVYQKNLRMKEAIKQIDENGQELILDAPESPVSVKIQHLSIYGEILKCFSAYSNTKFIFDTDSSPDMIESINGLRFIGMTWIISFHVIYYSVDFLDNKFRSLRMAEKPIGQFLTNANVAIHTYFVISGFLLAYLYFKTNLRHCTQNEPVKCKAKIAQFFGLIAKRFIRLTPAYMMTVGIAEITFAWYGETSIFQTTEKPQESCANNWWKSLLYIQNFLSPQDMCLSWTWYLANDMQYHIIGTFILIVSTVHFYTAATILIIIFCGSTVLAGYISYTIGYVPTLDEVINTMSVLYYSPWIRIGPFIVGIITAYILEKLNNNKLRLQMRYVVVLWLITGFSMVFVLFGMPDRQISVLSSSFYVALHHIAWAIASAWIIIACCTNHAGGLKTILSFKVWIPLGRLTYGAYLLNPLVIMFVKLRSESPTHFDYGSTFIIIFGTITITYSCSYVLSLMMETPYLLLLKLLTNKPRSEN